MSCSFYYSFLLDDVTDHICKADILLRTLERFAGVARDHIIVHCTDRVAQPVRQHLAGRVHEVVVVAPYLDGKYCNKLRQLDYFSKIGKSAAAGVFLLDIDMAVLSPLDVADRSVIWGKIVDGANPPLETLERVFEAAGVPLPEVVPCDWGNGETVATNLNGGFYYVPLALLPQLAATWRHWAEFLHARPELFGADRERIHMDQMAFAMATVGQRFAVNHLSANWNFPCHSPNIPQSFQAGEDIRGLHYHHCIDDFGLIAPVYRDNGGPVDTAVDRINDMIGSQSDDLFLFEEWKRRRARDLVRNLPPMDETPFPDALLARTRLPDGRKRRLILHAGTPKTGTSSLQHHLGSHREALAAQGVWYPPPDDQKVLKHQYLVPLLRAGDMAAFARAISGALADMPEEAHTIILTTEGIYNHWWDYPPESKALLRHLSHLFEFELCIWFREPVSFATALYAQYVKNPAAEDVMTNVYGRDIGFAEAMADGWFRRHLDYLGFLCEAQELFGPDRVRAFLYEGDTVEAFLRHYRIDDLPQPEHRQNPSMRAPGVAIMRIVNRYGLTGEERNRAEALVYEIDRLIGERGEQLHPRKAEKQIVRRCAARGWELIQARFHQH